MSRLGVRSESGASLLELLLASALVTTVGAAATPQLLGGLDDYRGAGAARYLTTRVARLRFEAVARSSHVGIRFVPDGATYVMEMHADGNGNGVRSRDMETGLDPLLGNPERLGDHFPGVEFAVTPDVPSVDAGGTPPGSDPIKLGNSNILAFSPLGTATSGSVYIRTRRGSQFVVRVFGETGRARALRLNPRTRTWGPL